MYELRVATRDIGQKWTDGLANATIDDYARLPNGFPPSGTVRKSNGTVRSPSSCTMMPLSTNSGLAPVLLRLSTSTPRTDEQIAGSGLPRYPFIFDN